jgi:predicted enzyme related to lactoylglutathione lyase
MVACMPDAPIALVEFPADDPERALRFWHGVLDADLQTRTPAEGQGWQTHAAGTALGLHKRGIGPGDTVSLPYFSVPDVADTLRRVADLGGSVVHSGQTIAICKDSEGSPFGIIAATPPA